MRPAVRSALAVAIGLLAVVSSWFVARHGGTLTERDTVVVADFENTTGEPIFDGTLKVALAVALEQSPFLKVFPDDQARDTLRLMGRSPDDRLTRGTAREIARTVLSLAREGLGRWAQESGDDARDLLDPLEDILDKGTLAERALAAFREGSEDPRALLSFWKIA